MYEYETIVEYMTNYIKNRILYPDMTYWRPFKAMEPPSGAHSVYDILVDHLRVIEVYFFKDGRTIICSNPSGEPESRVTPCNIADPKLFEKIDKELEYIISQEGWQCVKNQ